MKKLIFALAFLLLGLPLFNQVIPYQSGDRYGYANLAGKVVIEPVYTKVEAFNEHGYAVVYQEGKGRIIDTLGQAVKNFVNLPAGTWEFEKIYPTYDVVFRVILDGQQMLIDEHFQAIFKTEYHLSNWDREHQYITVTNYVDRVNKGQGIIDRQGNFIIPMGTSNVATHNMKGEAARPIFSRKQGKQRFLFNHEGRPLLDSLYDKVEVLIHDDFKLYLLRRGQQLDILSDALDLIYRDLDLTTYDDAAEFSRLQKATNFPAEVLAKIYGRNDKINCFVSPQDHCICQTKSSRTETKNFYRNGKSLISPEETFHLYSIKGKMLYVKKGEEIAAKNLNGEIVIPFTKDTFIIRYLPFTAIKREGKHYFYDATGKRIGEETYTSFDEYRLKKSEAGNYALHLQDGIPRTDFIFDDISRLNRKNWNAYLGQRSGGYSVLDSLGQETIFCDRVEKTNHRNYFACHKNGQMGIIDGQGQLIVPLNYDTVAVAQKVRLSSAFFAKRNGQVVDIYNSDGQLVYIPAAKTAGTTLLYLKDGSYRLDYAEEGKSEFYNSDFELIGTLANFKSESYDKLGKYGIMWIDRAYYFNPKNGVIYKEE